MNNAPNALPAQVTLFHTFLRAIVAKDLEELGFIAQVARDILKAHCQVNGLNLVDFYEEERGRITAGAHTFKSYAKSRRAGSAYKLSRHLRGMVWMVTTVDGLNERATPPRAIDAAHWEYTHKMATQMAVPVPYSARVMGETNDFLS